jgi:hypothetical protein
MMSDKEAQVRVPVRLAVVQQIRNPSPRPNSALINTTFQVVYPTDLVVKTIKDLGQTR